MLKGKEGAYTIMIHCRISGFGGSTSPGSLQAGPTSEDFTSIDGSGIGAKLGEMAGVVDILPRQRLCKLPSNWLKGWLSNWFRLWDPSMQEEW